MNDNELSALQNLQFKMNANELYIHSGKLHSSDKLAVIEPFRITQLNWFANEFSIT